MARYTKGALGAFSGKIGNIVGANWRTIDYLRSVPKPSKRPATEKQRAQRARFALAVGFLQPIKDVLNIGFGDAKQGRSTGYNTAVQAMLAGAITGEYPDYQIDFPELQLSRGGLIGLFGLEVSEAAPYELTVQWGSETNRFNSFADDDVLILLYNKGKKLFSIFEGAKREDGTAQVTLSPTFLGDEIVVWAFVVHRDGTGTSNSQFAGQVTVAGE